MEIVKLNKEKIFMLSSKLCASVVKLIPENIDDGDLSTATAPYYHN
jgi:hypothetical protein